jgi:hypothetical protein
MGELCCIHAVDSALLMAFLSCIYHILKRDMVFSISLLSQKIPHPHLCVVAGSVLPHRSYTHMCMHKEKSGKLAFPSVCFTTHKYVKIQTQSQDFL